MIRPAGADDAAAAAAVVRAVYDEYGMTWEPERYHADVVDLERHWISRGDPFFVAEESGGVVGTVGVDLSLHGVGSLQGCDCSLERLYVLQEARGSGLGSALLAAAVEGARAAGRRRMAIWSDKKLEDAHRLYARFGAETVAERIGDDPDRSAEWGLVLPL